MAAKGTESKNVLFAKLQEVYPNAFWEDQGKILRVPMDENGQRVEIKVTLTAAKTNLGGDEIASAFDNGPVAMPIPSQTTTAVNESNLTEPTEEEKQNIESLIKALGL